MKEEEKHALQSCYDMIVNSVQEHNIGARLVSDFILTPQDHELILAERTNQMKMVK